MEELEGSTWVGEGGKEGVGLIVASQRIFLSRDGASWANICSVY